MIARRRGWWLLASLLFAGGCYDFSYLGRLYAPDLEADLDPPPEDLAGNDKDGPTDFALTDAVLDLIALPDADRPRPDAWPDAGPDAWVTPPDRLIPTDFAIAVADLAIPADLRDLAVPDLAVPDLGAPDLTRIDGAPRDLALTPIQRRLLWSRVHTHSGSLYGVWADPKGADVHAVGVATILRKSDGWKNQITPSGDTYFAVRGHKTSTRIIVAGVNKSGAPLIQRSDMGGAFFAGGLGPDASALHGVWQDGAGDFMLVGTSSFFARGNGVAWTAQSLAFNSHFFAVTGTLSRLVAVGGGGLVAVTRDDAKTWVREDVMTPSTLHGASTSPGGDIWIVGDSSVVRLFPAGGNAWVNRDVPQVIGKLLLNSVWAASDNLVYAAGGGGYVISTVDRGMTWREEVQLPSTLLTAIHGSGDVVYAVASDGQIFTGQ